MISFQADSPYKHLESVVLLVTGILLLFRTLSHALFAEHGESIAVFTMISATGESIQKQIVDWCNDTVTHLVGEGKVADAVCLDFSKTFNTVSNSILLEKLEAYGLD